MSKKSKKEIIAEKRINLQKNFAKVMKSLDEDGQAMLQTILDEIDSIYALADEEGVGELITALQEKIKALQDAQPTEEAVAAAEEEMKKLKQAIADLRLGGNGSGEKIKSLREFIRENADKIKALKNNQGASLNLTFKADRITVGGNINSDPQYLPMPEADNEIGRIPTLERTILQDVDSRGTSSTRIVYIDELPVEGNAAFIAEGTLKPSASKTWKTAYADVKKVAVTAKVSNEMLEDIDFVEGEIEAMVEELVTVKIEQGILEGDGNGQNLKGIVPQVGGFITPVYTGSVKTPNTADVIFVVASQIRDLGYKGNLTIYLNSSEINKMRLVKDANGNYMSFGTILENITIKSNPDLDGGEFLIGDFKKIHVRFKKEIGLEWGYGTVTDEDGEVKSDWEMNFITVRCEARLAMYVKTNDIKGFVFDNIDTVKADIAS